MAYNTRQLRREGKPPSGQLASPVPQYWNPTIEDFEDVIGNHGAPYAMLVGPNGQPISSSNRLPVADQAVAQALTQLASEGKLEQVRVLLESLASKAATETTLAQVLAKLSNDPATAANQQAAKTVLDALASKDFATQATLAQVLARLEAIEEQLDTGSAKVALTGQNMPPGTSVPVSLVGSNDFKRGSIGAFVTHVWSRLARGINVDFATSGTSPLVPGESAVVVDVTGPGRLVWARFSTNVLASTAQLNMFVDGTQVAGTGAAQLVGFYSLMDPSRMGLPAGRTYGPWEITNNADNKYSLSLDGSKMGAWGSSFKIELANSPGASADLAISSTVWMAVMSSERIVCCHGANIESREIVATMADHYGSFYDYTVVTRPGDEDESSWVYEVFWRNDLHRHDVARVLSDAFGLVEVPQ